MMILCQGAPFDIATTSGIAQSVMLRFVDGDGAAKDISGNAFRCAVRGPGAAAIKCDPVDGTSARLAWSPLKAGAHAYDLFMAAPDGAERPLIMGEIQAAPRVTPPRNEDVVTIGEIEIIVPDAADGEVKIIDPAADAAERAEAAAQKAETSGTDADAARKDAEAALKLANDAAAAAQKALAAMPLPDGNGNITVQGNVLAQGATFGNTVNANGGINLPIMPVMDTDCANLAFVKAFNSLFISTCDYINVAITGDANRYKVYPDRVYCKDTWGISEYTRCEITSLRLGTDYEGSDCVFIPCDILAKNRAPAQKISISWGGTVNSNQSVLDWDVDASALFSLTIELLFQDDAGESSTRSIQVRKRQMGGNQETVVETDWQSVEAYPDNFANGGDTVLSIGLVYAQKSENWEEAEGCLYFLCYHITRGRYYAFPLVRTHGKHNYFSRLSSPRIILTNEAYGTAKAYGNVHLDAPIIYYGPNNAFYQFIISIEHTF